jgi:hypothetical protein
MRQVPWRQGLRSLVGPDPAHAQQLLAAKAEIARLTAELVLEREAAEALLADMNVAVDALLEPARHPDCNKIRLRNKAEAEAFARRLEEDTGREHGSLEGYRCTVCPRQPALDRQQSPGRYYHVRNRARGERSSGAKVKRTAAWKRVMAAARRNGALLEQRIDPAVLTRLRQRSASDG